MVGLNSGIPIDEPNQAISTTEASGALKTHIANLPVTAPMAETPSIAVKPHGTHSSPTIVATAGLASEPTAQEIESITSEIASIVSTSISNPDNKSVDGTTLSQGNRPKVSNPVASTTSTPSFADTFDSVLQTMLLGETDIKPPSQPHWLADWHVFLLLLSGLVHGLVYAWELKQYYPDNWLDILNLQLSDAKMPDSSHIVCPLYFNTPCSYQPNNFA